MKRNLLSFAALTAAVLFSGSIFAQTERASVSLEFNGEGGTKPQVKAAVYNDHSFKLSVPAVKVAFDEIGVQINGQTQKTVTSSLSGTYFNLSEQLDNIYSFGGATIDATIVAGENDDVNFTYQMSMQDATTIAATTSDASAAFSLLKTYGEAAGAQGGNLLIKAGSYINYGGKVLRFTQDFVGTKDIDVLFANFQSSTTFNESGDNNFEIYLVPGSKLAMGNSGRAFMYPTTITMDIAGNGDALAALQTSSLSTFIEKTLLFVNDLIGAIDTKNDVTLTIEIADPWETLRGAKSVLLPEGKDHDLTVGEFGTFVSEYEISDFRGAEVYSINKRDDALNVVDLVEVSNIVAGHPYIFRATSNKLQAIINWGAQGTYTAANGLYPACDAVFGSPLSIYYSIPENAGWYIIKNNILRLCGANCGLYEGTAAIKLSEIDPVGSVPQHVGKHLRVAVSQDATEGIEDAQAEVAATKMIVNGQLVIVKNGVMYNAAGMQVK